MILNMTYGSSGSGGTLSVTAPAGVTVTAAKDGKSYTRTANADGIAVFKGLASGTWEVTISDGARPSVTLPVVIVTDYAVTLDFEMLPQFTYTGDYEIVNDEDEAITSSQGNWKIRLLTSGTLTFTDLRGAAEGIDVFLVGGGGGGNGYGGAGGGGGYTNTSTMPVQQNIPIDVVVGAGGVADVADGGNTSFGILSASGGKRAVSTTGGNGGSGGGSSYYGEGGSDGSNGGSLNGCTGGNGQGTTTREFGESSGKLYSGGGGGATVTHGAATGGLGGAGGGGNGTGPDIIGGAGETNTGGGGGGGGPRVSGGSGGSGIVVIRNKREVA